MTPKPQKGEIDEAQPSGSPTDLPFFHVEADLECHDMSLVRTILFRPSSGGAAVAESALCR